jgi:hypothetical protein
MTVGRHHDSRPTSQQYLYSVPMAELILKRRSEVSYGREKLADLLVEVLVQQERKRILRAR